MKWVLQVLIAAFLGLLAACQALENNNTPTVEAPKVVAPVLTPYDSLRIFCEKLPQLKLPFTDSSLFHYGYKKDSLEWQQKRYPIDSNLVITLGLKNLAVDCSLGCQYWTVGYVKNAQNVIYLLYGFSTVDMLEYYIKVIPNKGTEKGDIPFLFTQYNNSGPLEVRRKSRWTKNGLDVIIEGRMPNQSKWSDLHYYSLITFNEDGSTYSLKLPKKSFPTLF